MFRLIFLTIGGLFTVLLIFGGHDTSTPQSPPSPAVQTAAEPEDQAPVVVDGVSLTTIAAPVADSAPSPQRPRFAGPRLQPSPEHRASSATPAEETAIPANALYVTGAAVNLRAGPTTEADIVTKLSRGTRVEPLGPTTGAWIQLRTLDGSRGFMSASFLSPNDPS